MNNDGFFYKLPIEETRVYIKRDGQKEDWVFTIETDFSKGPLIDLSIPDMGGVAGGFPKNESQYQWMQHTFHQNDEWFHWTFRKPAQYEKILAVLEDNFQLQSISVSCESPYTLEKILNYHPGEKKCQRYLLELNRFPSTEPDQEISLWFIPNENNQIEIEIKGGNSPKFSQWWQGFLKDNQYIEKDSLSQKFRTSLENYDKLLQAAAKISPKNISHIFSSIDFEVK